jgi:hypothetical protein
MLSRGAALYIFIEKLAILRGGFLFPDKAAVAI